MTSVEVAMGPVSCETSSIERRTVLLHKAAETSACISISYASICASTSQRGTSSQKSTKSLFSAARGTQANHRPAACRKSIGAFRMGCSQSGATPCEQGPLWFCCRRENICFTTTQTRQRLWSPKWAAHHHARNTITLLVRDCDRVRSLYGDVFKEAA
jgi:hypothetical protein